MSINNWEVLAAEMYVVDRNGCEKCGSLLKEADLRLRCGIRLSADIADYAGERRMLLSDIPRVVCHSRSRPWLVEVGGGGEEILIKILSLVNNIRLTVGKRPLC